ncbi:MAG: amino acid adenylation [Gammaproteobacteria bacterium]|nr:amino acid adenylation [Gammaproteobacteria bacterium]
MLTKITPLFSASNALCKWLKSDLPRLPTSDGKQIGIQPLVTDANTVSWQCHVIFTDSWRQHATVIAVEANSRFTLLIPFDDVPTQQKLEQLICEQWANELVELLLRQGEINRDQVARIFNHFYQRTQNSEWVRNTDLSVNGHVSDAEQWVKQTLSGRGLDALDDDLAIELAWHINTQEKQAKDSQGNKRRFYPPALFLEDGLARFLDLS